MAKTIEELTRDYDALNKLLLGGIVNDTFQPGLAQQVIQLQLTMQSLEHQVELTNKAIRMGIMVLALQIFLSLGTDPEVIKVLGGLIGRGK